MNAPDPEYPTYDYTDFDLDALEAVRKLFDEHRDRLGRDIEKLDEEILKVCKAIARKS